MKKRSLHVRMDDGTEVEVRWGPGEKFTLTVDDRSSVDPAPVAETPPAEGTTQVEQQRAKAEGAA